MTNRGIGSKILTLPPSSIKTSSACLFFNHVGEILFGESWHAGIVRTNAHPWQISRKMTVQTDQERKSIVQEAILEALADGRVTATLVDNGVSLRNFIYRHWLKHVSEKYREYLPQTPPHTKKEVKEIVDTALKGRFVSDFYAAQAKDQNNHKQKDECNEDEYEDEEAFSSLTLDERLELHLQDARNYLMQGLFELCSNMPTAVEFKLEKELWSELSGRSVIEKGELDWSASTVHVKGDWIDADYVMPPEETKNQNSRSRHSGVLKSNRSERFKWDGINEDAYSEFVRHLESTGPHEFEIQDFRPALDRVVNDPPWREVSNWGPLKNESYQSYWLAVTLATWRLLAIRPELAAKQKLLVDELAKFLEKQYSDQDKFPFHARVASLNRLEVIVRPVLAQFRRRTPSGDIFNALAKIHIKKSSSSSDTRGSPEITEES